MKPSEGSHKLTEELLCNVMQVAKLNVPYIMMHMRGTPATMQQPENTAYHDVCAEVAAELNERIRAAVAAGIKPWMIITDPGGSCADCVIQTPTVHMSVQKVHLDWKAALILLEGLNTARNACQTA